MNEAETPLSIRHHPRRDSARWTDNYLYNQLIPYIGNKRKLLDLIAEAIEQTGCHSGAFLDLFAGSGVVSRLAKVLGFRVISNDWEPYTFEINSAYIALNSPPPFKELGGIEKAFAYLNGLQGLDGYIARHYCPTNDSNPDPSVERMFFTRKNGRKIDAIRETIERWWNENLITRSEKSVLLAALIYSASYVSNTSGVFKGFHNGWGGRSGVALYRILSDLELRPPVFYRDNLESHEVFMEDANSLVRKLPPVEIAYLDPPYNQHQYGANYHILNTIALWDKPKVKKTFMENGRRWEKSAIRKDWRTERRSRYCYKGSAQDALEDLIENLDARWICLSYSSDGILQKDRVGEILERYGKVTEVRRLYKRYRVSPTRPSPRPSTTEFIFVLKRDKRLQRTAVRPRLGSLMNHPARF